MRLGAERRFAAMLTELVDAKVRRDLRGENASQLAEVVLSCDLPPGSNGGLLLDQFRYRLAHVAMAHRDWDLAIQLLERVLEGQGDLRLARLFLSFCRSRSSEAPLPRSELCDLVTALLQPPPREPEQVQPDVLVQDPITNLAELFLLEQSADQEVIAQLYGPKPEDSTHQLTLFLCPDSDKEGQSVTLSEWLARRQLQELKEEGWLVVDCCAGLGRLGQGSPVRHPNGDLKIPRLLACLQILGRKAPQPMTLQTVRRQFFDQAGPELIGTPGTPDHFGEDSPNPVQLERAPGGVLVAPGHRKVIDNTGGQWRLQAPYAVIRRDARRHWSQSLGRP